MKRLCVLLLLAGFVGVVSTGCGGDAVKGDPEYKREKAEVDLKDMDRSKNTASLPEGVTM